MTATEKIVSKENTSGLALESLFKSFEGMKVMVVGDVMIDAYLWGKVDRISPEAPVPIVAVDRHEKRMGGAANVAINLVAMGAIPLLCSVIGDDRHATEMIGLAAEMSMDPSGLVRSANQRTTVKTRVIGNNHQLIRVDEEIIRELDPHEQQMLLVRIKQIAEKEKPQVLIFEDYDKGVLSKNIIAEIVEFCAHSGISVTVDPKKKNFSDYKSVQLFKPNLSELRSGIKADISPRDASQFHEATKTFRDNQDIEMLMVTLSEAGVFWSRGDEYGLIPAHLRNISDVSGAGDTVIAVASLCMGRGLHPAQIAALSNLAGGQVCEKVGVAPVDKQQLLIEAESLSL